MNELPRPSVLKYIAQTAYLWDSGPRVTHWALGHGCFRRSAGFGVGGIGIVRDRGRPTVARHDIGSAVTVLEADVGWRRRRAPSALARPVAVEANAGPRRRPSPVAPSARRRASRTELLRARMPVAPEKRW